MQKLPETELTNKETALSKCARDVEADDGLNNEMRDWETTVSDGIRKQLMESKRDAISRNAKQAETNLKKRTVKKGGMKDLFKNLESD